MQQFCVKFRGMKKETLLIRYIEGKLNSFQSQQMLGFSERKYVAALFMLSGASMKFRSEKLKFSYSCYRRWATDAAFKKLAQEFIDEFASLVIQHVRSKVTNCRYEDFANLDWTEILDANSYSKPLKKRLEALYLKETKTFKDRRFLFAMCSILNLTRSIPQKEFDRLVKTVGQTNNIALKLFYMTARSVIKKYSLTVVDKTFVRQVLDISERLIFQQ